ncbi:MAG: ATP-binding protein [Gammaproteobacteria bacterium]
MKSIETRLNLGLGLSLVLVFIAVGIGVSVSIRLLTEDYVASRLEHDTDSLLVALTFPEPGVRGALRPGRINPIYGQIFSGHYYRIQVGNHIIRSRSLWDQDLKAPTLAPGEVTRFREAGPQGQLLLVRTAGFRKNGHDLSIAVAEDLTPIRVDVRRFQLRYALFSLGALVVLLLLQRYVLRMGLAPLARTREQIGELERGERRQLGEDMPREIRPVVGEINHLLNALQQRLERSRNALGNLAHALKAPLTLIGQLADGKELAAHPEVQGRLRDHVERIRGLMDRELKRARLAGAAPAGGRVQLDREVDALVQVLRSLYRDKVLSIDARVPEGGTFPADKEDLLELLGNLLDNACKWARARVRITVELSNGDLDLRVEDDGPGRSPDDLAALSRRGVRVDEDATPGHGLGLAIVRDVVKYYGGTMEFSRSVDYGGFQVDVRLPGAGRIHSAE